MAGYKIRLGDGSEIGPMDLAAMRTWISQGLVDQDSPVMCPGSRRWVPLGTVAELRGQAVAARPPARHASRRGAARPVENENEDDLDGGAGLTVGRPAVVGVLLLVVAAAFGWLAWRPEAALPALDGAPWLQISLAAAALGLALLPGWDFARRVVRVVLLLAALALFPIAGILLAQGQRGVALLALGAVFLLAVGLWALLAPSLRWPGLALALVAVLVGAAAGVRFGHAPVTESMRQVLGWSTPDRRFADESAGLSLEIPPGWVVLRPGSPLVTVPATARLTLAQPRQGGFGWLLAEPAPKGVATPEQYLDRLVSQRRSERPGYEEGARVNAAIGTLSGRRALGAWRDGDVRQRELIVAGLDGWMAFALVAWMPEAGANRPEGLDALAAGLVARGALAARFRQAVDAAVAAVPHLTSAAAEQLMARSEARVLEPDQAFRRSVAALSERLPSLSAAESRELAGLTAAAYAGVPWSDRGRLSSYIERVRRGDVTAAEEDRAMARLMKVAEEQLSAARRLRLQAYYEKAILQN